LDINVTGAYIYFIIPIFGGIPVTQTTVSCLLVTVILMILGIRLGKNLQKRPGRVQVLVEKGVTMLYDLVASTMGPHNLRFAPLVGTIFLSSIFGSFIGLTGFLRSTTADLSTTLTWSVMVSVVIWYQSIKQNGFLGWLKGFTEPIVVMTPMNILSEIAQPVAMGLRHFGNVAGGGVITSILYAALSGLSTVILGLISQTVILPAAMAVAGIFLWLKGKKAGKIFGGIFAVLGGLGALQYFGILSNVPIFQFGIPAVLSLYFDLFSGFVQAFVFILLTMVYIGSACPAPSQADAE